MRKTEAKEKGKEVQGERKIDWEEETKTEGTNKHLLMRPSDRIKKFRSHDFVH